jgi:NAD(P)-dependent dehydrogenase (short-subunit alcohol dehydrogenase family)
MYGFIEAPSRTIKSIIQSEDSLPEDLKGKTALVTGASRGIGAAAAIALARAGASRVVIHYGSYREGAEETLALVEGAGAEADLIAGDLGTSEGIQAFTAELKRTAPAVDILVKAQTAGTIANKVDPGFMQVLENSGIDAEDFFKGLKEAADHGIEQTLPPGQVHALKDLMMPALARVGLLTPTVLKKYEEAGIPVFEDPRVLNAMEGGHPTGEAVAAE